MNALDPEFQFNCKELTTNMNFLDIIVKIKNNKF